MALNETFSVEFDSLRIKTSMIFLTGYMSVLTSVEELERYV